VKSEVLTSAKAGRPASFAEKTQTAAFRPRCSTQVAVMLITVGSGGSRMDRWKL
jgi:hypothetical protein